MSLPPAIRAGDVARAAQDAAVQPAGVADQVGPGEEGAHGVAEEEIGDAGKDLGGPPAQLLHVLHRVAPAVLISEVDHGAALHQGLAVAQVVVGHHGEAVAAEEAGEGLVAGAVLRHAVGDLHHPGDGAAQGRPLVDMDQGPAVAGWKVELRRDHHGQLLLYPIWHYIYFTTPAGKRIGIFLRDPTENFLALPLVRYYNEIRGGGRIRPRKERSVSHEFF